MRTFGTDYLFRFSGIIRNRFFGGSGGGPEISATTGSNDVSGRSAGNSFAEWSPWLSYSYTRSNNDLSSTAHDGDLHNVLLGADYSFSERLIAGVALGYENNDLDTGFNAGTLESDGYTVAPYLAYLIADTVSIDASFGYSDLSIDQTRTNPVGGNIIRSDTNSDRWFVTGNVNSYHSHGELTLLGRVGVIYSEDDQDGFTEQGTGGQTVAGSKSRFGQIQIGGEMAYSAHAIEPYVGTYYQYDFESQRPQVAAGQATPSDDDDDFRFTAGFRYFGQSGLSATLEYSGIAGRQDYDSHTVNLIGRLQF